MVAVSSVISFGQTLKSEATTHRIYVPTLVEDRAGKLIYDIPSEEFVVIDNGTARQVVLAEGMTRQPITLVLVIRTRQNSQEELQVIGGLSGLLNAVVSQPLDQTAIIAYDQDPHLIQDLTSNSNDIDSSLSGLRPGNNGASLYDAIHLAFDVVRRAPKDAQKVILLVGGSRDHGSNLSDPTSLLEDVGTQNIAIYGLAFHQPHKGISADLHTLNPFGALAMGQNAAQSLAQMTGGDFFEFKNIKTFEARMLEVASHIHNRYMLQLDTTGAAPGHHSLRVNVQIEGEHRVLARTAYFVPGKSTDTVQSSAQSSK
jgi:VWFA-related protein